VNVRVFREVLPSGLTVVTIEARHLHSAMAAVYARVGSRHETPENNGVSHVLEHLFFRGSERYPDSVEMNARVEQVGGNLNGVTMRDSSYFYTPVHPDGVAEALDILGDMLTRPRLVQLAVEKRVILEEMLDEVDERGRDVDPDNLSKRLLYGRHPLALKIAGTPETVQALTTRQVRAHFERTYVSGNLVVSVAGPVRHADVVASAKRAFRHVRRGPRLTEQPPPVTPARGPRLKYVTLDESQVEFRLAFPAISDAHPDHHALATLRRVLDDGLSSRLPHNIVERRGLAYSIGAAMELFHDAGSFEIDGACAPDHLGPVLDEVIKTLRTLAQGRISAEELTRAQRRHRMHLDFLRDSPGDLCGWFGGGELFRPPETFAARAAAVDALTLDDLVRVARQYLAGHALTLVAVGPKSAHKAVKQLLGEAPRRLASTGANHRRFAG
jgi:predicted Zn-dependent peptidase